MSRTYRKYIRRPFCGGSNTEYYHEKRRHLRTMLRRGLFNALASENPDETFAHPETLVPFVDRWREPTDGHSLITRETANARQIEIDLKNGFTNEWMAFCKRKWYSKLKRKHKERGCRK